MSSLCNNVADVLLHLRDVLIGNFNARSRGNFDIDHKLAGIGARERTPRRAEGKSKKLSETKSAKLHTTSNGPFQARRYAAFIGVLQALELPVEPDDDAAETVPSARLFVQ